jgi:hypothetical protein
MGTHPAGRYGICRKHIHDSNVFEEFLSLICQVYSLRFAEFTLGFAEFTLGFAEFTLCDVMDFAKNIVLNPRYLKSFYL